MNTTCKLCNGTYDFRSILFRDCFGEMGIAFAGGSGKADADNRFRFCPACGKELTKENFNGEEQYFDDDADKE